MKASTARQATDKARVVDMTGIYKKIDAAAQGGHDHLQLPVGSWKTPNSVDNIMADLKANGYTVKRDQGYDQRDGDGWDNLQISW